MKSHTGRIELSNSATHFLVASVSSSELKCLLQFIFISAHCLVLYVYSILELNLHKIRPLCKETEN
jgi:hypothetical protein